MTVNHSVECPLTNKDTAILSGAVSVKEPYSSGVFRTSWRRLLQGGGWTEVWYDLRHAARDLAPRL